MSEDTNISERSLNEMNNSELLQLTLELYARASNTRVTEEVHNRSVSAVAELDKRLKANVDKKYVLKWHSGDSSHVYDDFTDAIQRLRYYNSRDATLIVIDTEEMAIEEIYLSAAV